VLPKKHKADYFILGILGALTVGVLFLLIFWDMVKQDRSGTLRSRSTHSTNINGTIVSYTLFDRLGISVARSKKILLKNELSKADVLFQLNPTIPIYSDEVQDIRAWLISGGVLICTEIPRGFTRELQALGMNNNRIGRYRSGSLRPGTSRSSETSIPAAYQNFPLARDISKIYFETSEIINIDLRDPNEYNNAVEPLLADDHGTRILSYKIGQGRFIILSDSSFMANGQIGKGDNSVLAANLVSYALSKARGDKAVFDEYHLGAGYHESGFSVLSKLLFTTTAGWTVLSLTAAGVLYLIYKGRRFGSRRDLEKKQRRSKLEYIYGVGATYRSAGANRLTLELIFIWLKRKAIGLLGLAHNASNRIIAEELSRRTGAESRKYKEVLDKCDEMLSKATLSERQLLLTIKQLAQIETEVFNEHRNRK
jgi:hypothetical protein